MTREELSQLYYLNREAEEMQERLGELENIATSSTTIITGMPHGTGISDKVGNYCAEIADIKELLNINLKRCLCEINRLNTFINGIDDSQMRMIMRLRYINGMTWSMVAANISECVSEDSVRKAHDRFLKNISSREI
ncbi:MAG: hypothetical protein GX309_04610 [Clostridiales bacterium]|nr:hypothetical protein [Clostridiales bacterium]